MDITDFYSVFSSLFEEEDAPADAGDAHAETQLHSLIKKTTKMIQILSAMDSEGYLKGVYDAKSFERPIGMMVQAIESLLMEGVSVNARDHDNITPLHLACQGKHIEIVETLLNHGAHIDSSCMLNRYTPLHIATARGNVEIVDLLLRRGANMNACSKNNVTPIYVATEKGHETIVKLLLANGANVNSQNVNGTTILYLAVQRANLAIIECILKFSPDIKNENNRKSLLFAICHPVYKYKKIVKDLLTYGFTIDAEDVNNRELMQSAVENGYVKVVEDLLGYGVDVNIPAIEGFSILHSATLHNHTAVAELLIEHGADVNVKDEDERTPIFYAVKFLNKTIIKLLITKGAIVNVDQLFAAVEKDAVEIVEILLQCESGIDINAVDEEGKTALHLAVIDRVSIYGHFFHKNLKENIPKIQIAKLLLNNGADVNIRSSDGATPLYYAVQTDYLNMVKCLVEYNADTNIVTRENGTALHMSTLNRNAAISEILLNNGANVDKKENDGKTPLHMAAQSGCVEVVKILIKYGANIDIKDVYDRTSLHIACQCGHADIVESLLAGGADINITSHDEYTPLDFARGTFCLTQRLQPQNICYGFWLCLCARSGFPVVADSRDNTIKILVRHLIKIKAANLHISARYGEIDSGNSELTSYLSSCEQEIRKCKIEIIGTSTVSFYDVLSKDIHKVSALAMNHSVVSVIELGEYKNRFPIYADMIENNFKRGQQRRTLLTSGASSFNSLSGYKLPDIFTMQMFTYLSDADLKNLAHAYPDPDEE